MVAAWRLARPARLRIVRFFFRGFRVALRAFKVSGLGFLGVEGFGLLGFRAQGF